MPVSLTLCTPGYWPLPRFRRICLFGRWQALQPEKAGEKAAAYSIRAPPQLSGPDSLIVLEAPLKGALPRQVILAFGARSPASRPKRFTLRRWIGGLYSNCPPASISQVRLFYQAIAPAYRRHVEPSRAHQLAAFVPLFAPGSRVLDASCGDGTFAKMAGKKLKVWCNDLSPAMLALIPRRLAPPSRRSVSSASRLPHPAASFDGVLHSFSNLHSFDRRAFASFFRVLRNGGLLAYHPVKAPGERWPPHFHARTLAALRKAGFHSVESKWLESAGKKKTRLRVYLARK